MNQLSSDEVVRESCCRIIMYYRMLGVFVLPFLMFQHMFGLLTVEFHRSPKLRYLRFDFALLRHYFIAGR